MNRRTRTNQGINNGLGGKQRAYTNKRRTAIEIQQDQAKKRRENEQQRRSMQTFLGGVTGGVRTEQDVWEAIRDRRKLYYSTRNS